VATHLWNQCLRSLEHELAGADFNTWIRPLQAVEEADALRLLAPNQFVLNWVRDNYYQKISGMLQHLRPDRVPSLILQVGSRSSGIAGTRVVRRAGEVASRLMQAVKTPNPAAAVVEAQKPNTRLHTATGASSAVAPPLSPHVSGLNPQLTFEHFIAGHSNQLARTAALEIAEQNDESNTYNLLYLYGGVGLGKTHLLHAIGNHLVVRQPHTRIAYLHSERFVGELVKALREKTVGEFKKYYRSLDTLLIDDVQFFAHKQQSQEELLHTFNILFEAGKRIVLVGDRPPQQLEGLEERLKSRFSCGLSIAVTAPDYATRVAILKAKAAAQRMPFSDEVCEFIATHVQSSVRELEGALHRVIAMARFTGQAVTLASTQNALQDMLMLEKPLLNIASIQQNVADYFKISVPDMCSRRRHRHLSRPRQMAMSLIKELTRHSYPEIGEAFGGRDHSTVIHSCKTVAKLKQTDAQVRQDYEHLQKVFMA